MLAGKQNHREGKPKTLPLRVYFANIQMGNFIWGRVYGLGKIGRGKVYDSLQEYSPLDIFAPIVNVLFSPVEHVINVYFIALVYCSNQVFAKLYT